MAAGNADQWRLDDCGTVTQSPSCCCRCHHCAQQLALVWLGVAQTFESGQEGGERQAKGVACRKAARCTQSVDVDARGEEAECSVWQGRWGGARARECVHLAGRARRRSEVRQSIGLPGSRLSRTLPSRDVSVHPAAAICDRAGVDLHTQTPREEVLKCRVAGLQIL